MSFIIYDLSFLVLFSLAVGIFLYVERKKLVREGPMFLYKTKIGLEVIEYFGKKFPKTLKAMSYVIVATGYALMVSAIYFIFQILWMFSNPAVVKMVKVPPIMPLIPYIGEIFQASWLPPFYFTYWIVAIALVAIFHEGFHGIFAKFNKIRIKSTGFGFLGPFLAFFVEQDDKQMQKAKIFPQLTVLAAGVFANVLLTIIFFLLLGGFFSAAYSQGGAIFNDYSYVVAPASVLLNASVMNETLTVRNVSFAKINLANNSFFVQGTLLNGNFTKDNQTLIKMYQDQPAIENQVVGYITEINGNKIRTNEDIVKQLADKKPGETVTITTKLGNQTNTYEFALGADYTNNSRAVIGIASYSGQQAGHSLRVFISNLIGKFQDPSVHYEPKMNADFTTFIYYLIWWIFMINFSVAIANMLPLGIFDGGRFFYLTILAITKKEKWAENSFKWATWLLLAVIALMMVFYFIGIF